VAANDDVVVTRPEEPTDYDAIAAVVSRAFGSTNEARLVTAIRESTNYVPGWSLVATVDRRVVGHVMVSYATLRDGSRERRVPNLSPLAVDPDHQRRGIGLALVRAVASEVDAAGEPLVVLEGSPWYYSKLGFEHCVPLGITIELPDWAPAEAGQVLRLSRYDPAVRGLVIYPPAFGAVAD
jgi:putative acetyltransferase